MTHAGFGCSASSVPRNNSGYLVNGWRWFCSYTWVNTYTTRCMYNWPDQSVACKVQPRNWTNCYGYYYHGLQSVQFWHLKCTQSGSFLNNLQLLHLLPDYTADNWLDSNSIWLNLQRRPVVADLRLSQCVVVGGQKPKHIWTRLFGGNSQELIHSFQLPIAGQKLRELGTYFVNCIRHRILCKENDSITCVSSSWMFFNSVVKFLLINRSVLKWTVQLESSKLNPGREANL